MPTIETDLDKVQSKLHDSGTLWPRTELLRFYNDGYKQLVARSKATQRFFVYDVPGQVTFAGVWEWEDRHSDKGIYRRFSRISAQEGYAGAFLWEVEQVEGISPTNSADCVSQLWERAFSDDIDQHFRFGLANSHERVTRVAYNDRPLAGISTRELDTLQTKWWRESGEPVYWLEGTGRDKSFEVFEVVTSYTQGYHLDGFEKGMPREPTGDRSYSADLVQREFEYAYTTDGDADGLTAETLLANYLVVRFTKKKTLSTDAHASQTWEREFIDDSDATSFTTGEVIGTYWWEIEYSVDSTYASAIKPALGLLRRVSSPDRQYMPTVYDSGQEQIGIGRDFKSSADSIMVLECITPLRDMTEADSPGLIPSRMQKYLRYYTLSRAFGRSGEGQRLDLSQHYMERFDRGVMFLKRLGDLAFKDRVYARSSIAISQEARPPRVSLPSEFERIW